MIVYTVKKCLNYLYSEIYYYTVLALCVLFTKYGHLMYNILYSHSVPKRVSSLVSF